jgi:hypothetical protein
VTFGGFLTLFGLKVIPVPAGEVGFSSTGRVGMWGGLDGVGGGVGMWAGLGGVAPCACGSFTTFLLLELGSGILADLKNYYFIFN